MSSVKTLVLSTPTESGDAALMDALDDAPFGVAVFDAKGALVTVSGGVAPLLGVPEARLKAGISQDVLFPGAAKSEGKGRIEVGHDRCVEWISRPRAQGGVAVTLRDVTAERAEIAALTRSENRFRDLTNVSADWFWETDSELRFTYFSNRHDQVMGTPGATIMGLRRDEIPGNLPGQQHRFSRNLETMRRRETFRDFDYDRLDADGRVRRMSVSGAPYFDDTGAFAGYRGTARDVTSLRRLSDELRVERARLQELMSNAPVPIVFKDTDLRFVTANDAFLTQFGMTRDDLSGKTAADVFKDADLLSITSLDITVLESREPTVREIVHGDQIYKVYKFPVFDTIGELVGIGGMMFNVTDRFLERQALAAAKNEAERANTAKSRFLARMSHELRTPLNAVIGFGEAMRAEIFGPIGQERYKEYVDDIIYSGQGLLTLVSDILDLSKIEADEFSLREEDLDLSTLTRRAAALTKAARPSSQSSLIVRDIVPEIMFHGDAAAVERIVINLVGNALKFTDGGEITVSLARIDDGARLTVRDTGAGIPADKLPEITQAFATGGDPLRLTTEGAGLGLAIVSALCEAHGAIMTIDSEEGMGTTCAVTFPAARVL